MNRSFHLPPRESCPALRLRVVGTVNYGNIPASVRLVAYTFHKISMHQAHFISWEQPEILLRRLNHEILPLNIQLPAKRQLTHPQFRVLQIILHFQILRLSFRIIVNHQLNRIQNRHHAGTLQF